MFVKRKRFEDILVDILSESGEARLYRGQTVQVEVCIGYEISIGMCILNTQILVSKHTFQLIGSMNLWEKCLLQGGGKQRTRWEWKILLCQKVRKCSENNADRSSLKRPPLGKYWHALNIKIMRLMDYNPLNKIGSHLSM